MKGNLFLVKVAFFLLSYTHHICLCQRKGLNITKGNALTITVVSKLMI